MTCRYEIRIEETRKPKVIKVKERRLLNRGKEKKEERRREAEGAEELYVLHGGGEKFGGDLVSVTKAEARGNVLLLRRGNGRRFAFKMPGRNRISVKKIIAKSQEKHNEEKANNEKSSKLSENVERNLMK